MKQGTDLVRDLCQQACKSQGGTHHENSDTATKKKSPAKKAADDLVNESVDEMDGGGMGYAAGEYRTRDDS